jgi:hypothetical protein
MRVFAILLAATLLAPAALGAQDSTPPSAGERERWQVTLDDGRILWDVRLVRLAGESLSVSRPDSLATVSLKHVTEVRLIQKSEVHLGTGGGAFNALVGGDDEVYDLSPLDFADRVKAMQKIFRYHPPEGAAPTQ